MDDSGSATVGLAGPARSLGYAGLARVGRWRARLVLGAPLALLGITLLHPFGAQLLAGQGVAPFVRGRWMLWMAVHIALPFAAGGTAWAVSQLIQPLRGRAAAVARAALGVFVVAYAMFDSVVGLGTGLLAQVAARAPAADQAAVDAAADAFFGARFGAPIGPVIVLGNVAWAVAAIAAAVALRRAGASRWTLWLLVAAGVVFAVDHAPPFGPTGMALLAAAVATRLRARTTRTPTPTPRPIDDPLAHPAMTGSA